MAQSGILNTVKKLLFLKYLLYSTDKLLDNISIPYFSSQSQGFRLWGFYRDVSLTMNMGSYSLYLKITLRHFSALLTTWLHDIPQVVSRKCRLTLAKNIPMQVSRHQDSRNRRKYEWITCQFNLKGNNFLHHATTVDKQVPVKTSVTKIDDKLHQTGQRR